jgi:hypothetical protein
MDGVNDDLKKVGVNNWRTVAMDQGSMVENK